MDKDVTHLVVVEGCEFHKPAMRECVCGRMFGEADLPLGPEPGPEATCPECGRQFYLDVHVRVLERKPSQEAEDANIA